jgi:hypothetical protein
MPSEDEGDAHRDGAGNQRPDPKKEEFVAAERPPIYGESVEQALEISP